MDGYDADMTIRQFQAYVHLNKNWGDAVKFKVRRGKQELTLTFQFPDEPPN